MRLTRVAGWILLGGYALAIVLPLIWVILNSVRQGSDILNTPWAIPHNPQWRNYVSAWTENGLGPAFLRSALVTVCTLIILIPVGSMAAYVLTRFPFPGSKLIYSTFVGGLMFPQFLTIVPLYILLSQLHLNNTIPGLILVYVAYSLAFTVFVLSGFFQNLPNELAEAAELDGCSDNATFWKIMLPISKPGLVVVTIFNAIGLWNEYSLSLVLMTSPDNQTLPVKIATMATAQQYQSDWGALFAGLVLVIVPILVIYWAFRDKIQEAMIAGAVKG